MFLNNLPECAHVGVGGDTLEHDHVGTQTQRPVHDVAMAGDPPDIRSAVVDVIPVRVERESGRERGPDHLPARGVLHPFGLAGRT